MGTTQKSCYWRINTCEKTIDAKYNRANEYVGVLQDELTSRTIRRQRRKALPKGELSRNRCTGKWAYL